MVNRLFHIVIQKVEIAGRMLLFRTRGCVVVGFEGLEA